ncbi:hypothetical protein C9J03_17210 [Photobacterium gaetbulicola]|uniref:Uncharacterized protein n=1 Tax=Photobacterium gaetbulicola Gung47 TaxID=658445 RepID=A0A0C5W4J9_9GAMM|nr:hypothetical protein [Photobacterium gaetbulicola]AJR06371.1 hypothetical protein H744_1c1348 [Photobacterium gaetbulicola Gung47]PSU05469.1 hypothetical protein C9J03_17210 [Photobacterium gaetbulicola]
MKKLFFITLLIPTVSISVNANSLNEDSFWQHYATTTSASFQSTSGTTTNSGSSHQVSGQNLYFDTVTAGRLGNSTYFSFIEAVVGKLNGTDKGHDQTPYGRELLEVNGLFSQQWDVTSSFQLGWNYYGIDRDITHTDIGKFGYSLGSVGLSAGYQWGKWSFTPVLNYIFSAKLGKDGLNDLGESEFDGYFFYPRISGKIASNGTRVMLGTEYFNGSNSEGTDVEYLKGVAKLTSPIGNSKKWAATGKLVHISYFAFDYFGIDMNPHQETSVSFGIQYNW